MRRRGRAVLQGRQVRARHGAFHHNAEASRASSRAANMADGPFPGTTSPSDPLAHNPLARGSRSLRTGTIPRVCSRTTPPPSARSRSSPPRRDDLTAYGHFHYWTTLRLNAILQPERSRDRRRLAKELGIASRRPREGCPESRTHQGGSGGHPTPADAAGGRQGGAYGGPLRFTGL